ncbi:MAG: hypothetical protein PHS82_05625 [Lachnospiraceae bacterium]|nr:hypothetical protein [Lachnospiraceae bacterium]
MSKFLKVIVNIFLVCAILIAGAILIPPVMGISTVVVDSTSMDTNLPMGSVTYAKDINVMNLQNGDKVLSESDLKTYAYVIEDGDATTGSYTVKDARNAGAESETITLRNSVPKIVFTAPLIGYVVMAMQSLEGIIIIGLVVLFVIILFVLSELWKKTDEDEDDEDETDDEDEEANETQTPAAEAPVVMPVDQEPVQPVVETLVREDTPTDDTIELPKEVKKADADKLILESQAELAAAVAMAQNGELQPLEEEEEKPVTGLTEEIKLNLSGLDAMAESEPEEEEDPNSFIPIPRESLEALMAQAKADGDEPEIVKDEQTGVTILDYSDII